MCHMSKAHSFKDDFTAAFEGNVNETIERNVSKLAEKFGFDEDEAIKYLNKILIFYSGSPNQQVMASMTSEETNDTAESFNAGNVAISNPIQIQTMNDATGTEDTNGPADQEQYDEWTSQRTSNVTVMDNTMIEEVQPTQNHSNPPAEESEQPSNELLQEIPLYTGSDTAKNGYKEEGIICDELNEDKNMKESLQPITGAHYDSCKRVSGNSKTDVASENGVLKTQIKKIFVKRFQQVDRGWINGLVNDIPSLHTIQEILCKCFEYPLKEDGRYVDKSVPLKKFTLDNYTQDELDLFIEVLNENKRKIVERAFLGYKESTQPNCLIASEYDKKKRNKIVAFKMNDIIDYLVTLDFKIAPRKTSVILGHDSVCQMKRKGGDGGKKASNHVQFMITVSKLYDNVPNCQHNL